VIAGCSAIGAHIAGPVAWLAVVDGDGNLMDDRADRLELEAAELSQSRSISEFEETVEHLLGRLVPGRLTLVRAGSSRLVTPSDSRRRGWIEAALMMAAQRSGVEFSDVTHEKIEKEFGARPTDSTFGRIMATRLEEDPPPRWKERAPAFAAALLAQGDG
jgi:hypothetical protein